jgi:hypothetical protein
MAVDRRNREAVDRRNREAVERIKPERVLMRCPRNREHEDAKMGDLACDLGIVQGSPVDNVIGKNDRKRFILP